ncbi:hypothetical protein KSF78_0008186 [Schistosoma japonicum]|nr:hypothetical protein KSF78_0008186 [Schistosoma japonicum]KAH8873864.1 hypothetical protein KSF78_0008186 [Schistosoma japonicum]
MLLLLIVSILRMRRLWLIVSHF